MATQIITQYTDDLDGTVADDIRTLTFSFDGANYEIDLRGVNEADFREAIAPYTRGARSV